MPMSTMSQAVLFKSESSALFQHPPCTDEKVEAPPESQIRMTCQDPLSWLQPDHWGTCQQLSSLSPLPLSRLPAKRTPRKHIDPSSASPRPATKDPFRCPGPPLPQETPNLRQSPQLARAALPPLPTHTYQQSVTQRFSSGEWGAPLSSLYSAQVTHPASASLGRDAWEPTPRWSGALQASAGLRPAPRPHFRRSLESALAGQRPESSHHRSEPTRVPDPGSHAAQPRGTQSPGPLPQKHPPGNLLLKPTNTSATSPAAPREDAVKPLNPGRSPGTRGPHQCMPTPRAAGPSTSAMEAPIRGRLAKAWELPHRSLGRVEPGYT